MKDFLETTFGRIILGIFVFLIWGVNAFNFSKLAGDDISTVSTVIDERSEITVPSKASYTYTNKGRDPFNQIAESPSSRVEEVILESTQYRHELILHGIFGNTAMLTINSKDPVFIKPGEFLEEGIMLKRIFTDSVHLEVGDELITLTVNE